MKSTSKDTRIRCPFCGIATWDSDYVYFMSDHDRPDGRKCQKAAKHVREDNNGQHH